MDSKVKWISLAVAAIVALTVVAGADTVTKTTRRGRVILRVAANATGREANDRRSIYDFHVYLANGRIVSHSSPNGWSGSSGETTAEFETASHPIHMGRSKGDFDIKITGTGQATWETTDGQGAVIASGSINLRGRAAQGKIRADTTTRAMQEADFSKTAQTITTIGTLSTQLYSSLPKAIQPFTQGPWSAETAAFHFDNLFAGQDVTNYWANLETVAESAVASLASNIAQNKCSAAVCTGHDTPTETCHEWNSSAAALLPERTELLLLIMGVTLDAVQSFYYNSNWVEQWDEAGKGEDIPTWDEALQLADAQSQTVIQSTVTGAYGGSSPPAGALHYAELTKESPLTPQGGSLAQDGATTYYELANQAALAAAKQWISKFETRIDDDALWGRLQRCDGVSRDQAEAYTDELAEIEGLFVTAQSWDDEIEPSGQVIAPVAFDKWQNRCAGAATRIFRDLLGGVSTNNPANKYLAVAPRPSMLASIDEAGVGLGEVIESLEQARQEAPEGEAQNLVAKAVGAAENALQALDAGTPVDAYLHSVQSTRNVRAAREALATQDAAPDVLAALDDAEIAVGAVVTQVAQVPQDIKVWTPSEVGEGEDWTGIVVAETPGGYQPYEGDLIVNGEAVPVENGKFEGPVLTRIGTTALFFGLKELLDDDRSISPEIDCLPAAEVADPFIATNSNFVHPREPLLVVTGEGLDQLSQAGLVNAAGQTVDLPISAGSSYQQIYLAPTNISPDDYHFVAETPDGTSVEGPADIGVPRFTVTTTAVTHVGQTGQITVSSTCDYPMEVQISGGEPYISIPEPIVEVSAAEPGTVGFTAQQPGTYSVIAWPIAVEGGEIEAGPLPGGEYGAGGTVGYLQETGGPDVFVGGNDSREWISGLISPDVLFDIGDKVAKGKQAQPVAKKKKKWEQRADKYEEAAKKAEKEAKEYEEEAKAGEKAAREAKTDKERADAERTAREARKKATRARERAAENRRRAAAAARSGGDRDRAADNEEAAAENERAAAENYEATRGPGTAARKANKRAAASEQRAAADRRASARKHAKNASKAAANGDHKGAAEEYNKAADDYDKAAGNHGRASQDYKNADDTWGPSRTAGQGRAASKAAEKMRAKAGAEASKAQGK